MILLADYPLHFVKRIREGKNEVRMMGSTSLERIGVAVMSSTAFCYMAQNIRVIVGRDSLQGQLYYISIDHGV